MTADLRRAYTTHRATTDVREKTQFQPNVQGFEVLTVIGNLGVSN